MNGANKLSAQDIRDGCWIHGIGELALWERRALRAVDNAWLAAQLDAAPKRTKK